MEKEYQKSTAGFSYDRCLSCTACMSVCPVMAASPDYRGPKLVGVAHERMHFAEDDTEDSLDLCSNCKNCDRTCPSGVAVSTLNMLQRAEYYKKHPQKKADDILAHHERVAKVMRKMPLGKHWANIGISLGGRLHAFKHVGLAKERKLPRYAPKNFYEIFKKLPQRHFDKKVLFYPGCYINEHEPHIGVAFVEIMQANGYETVIDKNFVCCGSPMLQSGYMDEVRANAEKNAAIVSAHAEKNVPVVACCTSCSLMLKQEYGELFGREEFFRAAKNVYDAFEFLAVLAEKNELNKNFRAAEQKKLLYHVPCHLKSQGIGAPAADILREAGFDVIFSEADCCGMAGTYGMRQDKYDISMKIGKKLFDFIKSENAAAVMSDCSACRMQIAHGTKQKALHPLEILAVAYKNNTKIS